MYEICTQNIEWYIAIITTNFYLIFKEFKNYRVEYVKLKVPGRIVPSKYCVNQ